MSREISVFKGQGVVIGCSHFHSFCRTKHLHQGEESFYTIDLDQYQKPDFVFDITSTLPEAFKSRFQLTFLEHLDFTAYNPFIEKHPGIQGFQNIWDMTTENGFILILGCPRQKECRELISMRQLHYIELDAEGECVLIPKNQKLSFPEVIVQIEILDPTLKKTIEKCRTHKNSKPNSKLGFCSLDYGQLSCFSSYNSQLNVQSKTEISQHSSDLLPSFFASKTPSTSLESDADTQAVKMVFSNHNHIEEENDRRIWRAALPRNKELAIRTAKSIAMIADRLNDIFDKHDWSEYPFKVTMKSTDLDRYYPLTTKWLNIHSKEWGHDQEIKILFSAEDNVFTGITSCQFLASFDDQTLDTFLERMTDILVNTRPTISK